MIPAIRFFSKVRRFIQLDHATRLAYLRHPDKDFTRRSPLTFRRTVSLVLDLARQSLAVELGRFFHWQPDNIVTKSAFCQRRQAIRPSFFRDLFNNTVDWFYRCFPDHQRWKGKRLMAVDGTGQALPNYPALGHELGFHLNQHASRPSTRLLLTHDVLNNVIHRVDLHTQNTAEIVQAYQNVALLPTDAVYIYDRHYASFALAYLHDRHGSDYVIRMKTAGGSRLVQDFAQSGERETVTRVKLRQGRALAKLRELSLDPVVGTEFKVRLVRVELDDGTIEVLMTSLTDRRRYPHRVFKWLYGKRWGVETAIFILKSFLQLALFSAYTQPGVEQDLWASFAFYNQQAVLVAACEDAVHQRTKHRQYEYRINRNVTAGLIQRFLYHIYLDGAATWRAKTKVLLELLPRYSEPYRPDRNRRRERKIMRMNNRHIHEKNYRKPM